MRDIDYQVCALGLCFLPRRPTPPRGSLLCVMVLIVFSGLLVSIWRLIVNRSLLTDQMLLVDS